MSFLALLLGLGVERLLTQVFHIREFRWLDPVFDSVFSRLKGKGVGAARAGAAALALALVLPIAGLSYAMADALMHIPYFLFSIVVLLFSLGPRDLNQEVEDYGSAVSCDNEEEQRKVAKELLEFDPPEDPAEFAKSIERAVYIQANNRIFAVVFWFIVLGSLGPLGAAGAWAFRVLDLMRRRVAFQYIRRDNEEREIIDLAVCGLHGWFAWIPARLLAVGYALAGSFEEAVHDWRDYYNRCAPRFFDITNDVIGCVGQGAARKETELSASDLSYPVSRMKAALTLVTRTLWMIWLPLIAILTLYNWLL